jgi:hypothetical protein
MDNQWSISEVIRRTALNYLAAHPNGIRAVELRKLTEEILSDYLPKTGKDSDRFKSALWDLEKRYPDYVVRIELQPRRVTLYPSDDLQKDIFNGKFEVPQLDSLELEKENSNQSFIGELKNLADELLEHNLTISPKLRMLMIAELVGQLSLHIEKSGLLTLLDVNEEDLKQMSKDDIEAVASLKMHLSIINKHRNQFFHGKF